MSASLCVAAVLLTAPVAVAQSEEPRPINPVRELDALQLGEINLALELEWRRNVGRIRDASGRRRDIEDRIREILEVRTDGYVGHPNLVEFDLGLRGWLEQRWVNLDGSRSTPEQTLAEWDASALWFRESDAPVTIYSRQNRADVDRQFGGSIESTFNEFGARVNLRHDVLPTNINVLRRTISQRDFLLDDEFDVHQDVLRADGRVHIDPRHLVAWDVRHEDVNESGDLRFARDFSRFESNATHTWQLGDSRHNVLRTRLRLYEENGDRPLRQIRVDPRLRLRHSESLNTWYDYSFARDDRRDQQQQSHRVAANVKHQLFESLTTIGSVTYRRFEVPNERYESDEVTARVDSTYVKQVPGGQLTAGFQGEVTRLDQTERGTVVVLADDLQTFDNANLIVIDRRNIVDGSIVVTSADALTVYTDGVDYTTLVFPGRAEIRRLVGGAISANETVSIDYSVGPDPGGTIDTNGYGFDVRYRLDEGPLRGLAVYASYFEQDEYRSVFIDGVPDNDFTDLRYGLEYIYGNVFLRGERQHRRGSLSPFESLRLEGRYVQVIGTGNTFSLSGLFQELNRDRDGIRTTNTSVAGQWSFLLNDQLRLSATLQYQWNDDSIGFDTEGFEQNLNVHWRRGQTQIYGEFRNSIRDTEDERRTLQRFVMGIRREF